MGVYLPDIMVTLYGCIPIPDIMVTYYVCIPIPDIMVTYYGCIPTRYIGHSLWVYTYQISLVPRLSKGEGLGEREPGFNRLRMRQLAVEFQGDRIPSGLLRYLPQD